MRSKEREERKRVYNQRYQPQKRTNNEKRRKAREEGGFNEDEGEEEAEYNVDEVKYKGNGVGKEKENEEGYHTSDLFNNEFKYIDTESSILERNNVAMEREWQADQDVGEDLTDDSIDYEIEIGTEDNLNNNNEAS